MKKISEFEDMGHVRFVNIATDSNMIVFQTPSRLLWYQLTLSPKLVLLYL